MNTPTNSPPETALLSVALQRTWPGDSFGFIEISAAVDYFD